MSQNFWVFSVLGWAGSELQGSSQWSSLSLSGAPGRLVPDTVSSRQGLRYSPNYCLTAQWSVGQTQTPNFPLSNCSPGLALAVWLLKCVGVSGGGPHVCMKPWWPAGWALTSVAGPGSDPPGIQHVLESDWPVQSDSARLGTLCWAAAWQCSVRSMESEKHDNGWE